MRNRKTRVWVIGTKGLPASYGGFETFAEQFCGNAASADIELIVVGESDFQVGARRYLANVICISSPFKANGAQSLLHDAWSIIVATRRSRSGRYDDHILLLGTSGGWILWLRTLINFPPIVTNIAGLEWSREKWGWVARRVLKFCESRCVLNSDIVVTDNEALQNYVGEVYGVDSKFIAYGGDQDSLLEADLSILNSGWGDFDLAVARAQPDNNIEMLLNVYSSNDQRLVMVSNWDSSEYGRKIKSEYGQCPSLSLIGPIYDRQKLKALYQNCRVYVHGHSAGGTNPTLVEAMCSGCDIFAYDVSYNRYTTGDNSLFFKNQSDLTSLLLQYEALPRDRAKRLLAEIAATKYSWDKVCLQYRELFR